MSLESRPLEILDSYGAKTAMRAMMSEAAKRFGITPSQAFVVLCHHNWNYDNVKNAFLEVTENERLKRNPRDPLHTFLNQYHMSATSNLKRSDLKDECSVCMSVDVIRWSAACGHKHCVNCWRQFFKYPLACSSVDFGCQTPYCAEMILEDDVYNMITDQDFLTRYNDLLLEKFLRTNPKVGHCRCGSILMQNYESRSQVFCSCGSEVCQKCLYQEHSPVDCTLFKQFCTEQWKWSAAIRLNQGDLTFCPSCSQHYAFLEGCDRVICQVCRTNFCISCGVHYSQHEGKTVEQKRIECIENRKQAAAALKKDLSYFIEFENDLENIRSLNEIKQKYTTRSGSSNQNNNVGGKIKSIGIAVKARESSMLITALRSTINDDEKLSLLLVDLNDWKFKLESLQKYLVDSFASGTLQTQTDVTSLAGQIESKRIDLVKTFAAVPWTPKA